MAPELQRLLAAGNDRAMYTFMAMIGRGEVRVTDLRAANNAALRFICELRCAQKSSGKPVSKCDEVQVGFLDLMRSAGLGAEDACVDNHALLFLAVEAGDAKLLRTLHYRFGLHRAQTHWPAGRSTDLGLNLLKEACKANSVAVIRSLLQMHRITPEQLAQSRALVGGHLGVRVARYLGKRFNFLASDALAVLKIAAAYAQPKLLRYTTGLTSRDIPANEIFLLVCNCRHGYDPSRALAVLRHLRDKYGLADCPRALVVACENGRAELVLELCTTFGLGAADARYDVSYALRRACTYGHAEALKCLHQTCGLCPEDARAVDNYALITASAGGHLEVVRTLQSLCGLGYADAAARNNYALSIACVSGHTDVVECLHKVYKLKAADARSANNKALRGASEHGHAKLVEKLRHWFQLTADDARAEANYALKRACQYGHSEVVQLLGEKYRLTADDARSGGNKAIKYAAKYGHAKVLQILSSVFKLTAADARADDNQALRYACKRGHANAALVLRTCFGLTAADARSCNNEALREATKGGNWNVVQELCRGFGLGAVDAYANQGEALREAWRLGHSKVLQCFKDDYKVPALFLRQAIQQGYKFRSTVRLDLTALRGLRNQLQLLELAESCGAVLTEALAQVDRGKISALHAALSAIEEAQ